MADQLSELIKRIERVGWHVRITGNGHAMVTTPSGKFTMPRRDGEPRGVKNALACARRFGLEQAEAALKKREERERDARNANVQQQNVRVLHQPTPLVLPFIEPAEREINMTNSSQPKPKYRRPEQIKITGRLDRKYVNDIVIVDRAPATYQTPIMKAPHTTTKIEELLLADSRVVYQCNVRPTVCFRVFSTVRGALIHTGACNDPEDVTDAATNTTTEPKSKIPQTKVDDGALTLTEILADIHDIVRSLDDAQVKLQYILAGIHNAAKSEADVLRKAEAYDKIHNMLNNS